MRKRGGRKRALGMRAPIALPGGSNERWSLDFVSDSFIDGRRFRILAIVEDFTRWQALRGTSGVLMPGEYGCRRSMGKNTKDMQLAVWIISQR